MRKKLVVLRLIWTASLEILGKKTYYKTYLGFSIHFNQLILTIFVIVFQIVINFMHHFQIVLAASIEKDKNHNVLLNVLIMISQNSRQSVLQVYHSLVPFVQIVYFANNSPREVSVEKCFRGCGCGKGVDLLRTWFKNPK